MPVHLLVALQLDLFLPWDTAQPLHLFPCHLSAAENTCFPYGSTLVANPSPADRQHALKEWTRQAQLADVALFYQSVLVLSCVSWTKGRIVGGISSERWTHVGKACPSTHQLRMQFSSLLQECKPFLIAEQHSICQVDTTNREKTALLSIGFVLKVLLNFSHKMIIMRSSGHALVAAVMPWLKHKPQKRAGHQYELVSVFHSLLVSVFSSDRFLQHVISNDDLIIMIGWELNECNQANLTAIELDTTFYNISPHFLISKWT